MTSNYINGLDLKKAQFEKVNEGFIYKDTFVFIDDENCSFGEESLLLIFQKNDRDETLIPCPSCRSHNVQGNSYPTLGVRSWECKNILCPGKSKYNRGKRYSFKSILMQEAINHEGNEIPAKHVRQWLRDVQYNRNLDEILEYLIRNYSLVKDKVHLFNFNINRVVKSFGRKLVKRNFKNIGLTSNSFFDKAAWFNRYVVQKKCSQTVSLSNIGDNLYQLYCGDSFELLGELQSNSIDAAITSPPYYNARKYATWDNIYGYLYDMYNVNRKVFRILKPGSYYLFNIFDYFDNENSIVFSAMGQKRMILSAYIVDTFRRIGFNLIGNITWDKGDIEGKRGFNSGNFSPYYQAPFNCWEHVLVFRKPPTKNSKSKSIHHRFPSILKAKPVFKIVKGENTHGHTAPFPDEIPKVLLNLLPKSATVLDPFAGSNTTGRVACRMGMKSIGLERSQEYCSLSLKLNVEESTISKIENEENSLQISF